MRPAQSDPRAEPRLRQLRLDFPPAGTEDQKSDSDSEPGGPARCSQARGDFTTDRPGRRDLQQERQPAGRSVSGLSPRFQSS